MKSTWTTNYKNNEIRVENTWFKGERLFVNDTLQDEKFGIFSSDLTGHIINTKNEKESIKVNLGGFWKVSSPMKKFKTFAVLLVPCSN